VGGGLGAKRPFSGIRLAFSDNGGVRIDKAAYFRSGWALRNMRGTPIEWAGTYLFPDPDRMVTDFSPAPISGFMARIEQRSSHPLDPSVAAGPEPDSCSRIASNE